MPLGAISRCTGWQAIFRSFLTVEVALFHPVTPGYTGTAFLLHLMPSWATGDVHIAPQRTVGVGSRLQRNLGDWAKKEARPHTLVVKMMLYRQIRDPAAHLEPLSQCLRNEDRSPHFSFKFGLTEQQQEFDLGIKYPLCNFQDMFVHFLLTPMHKVRAI